MSAPQIHGDSGLDGTDLPETDQKPITEAPFQYIFQKITSFAPRKVTIVATGSLTNVALLLMSYPEIKNHIE